MLRKKSALCWRRGKDSKSVEVTTTLAHCHAASTMLHAIHSQALPPLAVANAPPTTPQPGAELRNPD